MIRPVAVEAREGRRIWLQYSDGAAGEVDLSGMAGKGVFKAWDEPGCFEQVHIDAYGSVIWNEEIDLCPYALYMELTGKAWDELPDEDHVEGMTRDA